MKKVRQNEADGDTFNGFHLLIADQGAFQGTRGRHSKGMNKYENKMLYSFPLCSALWMAH